MADGLDPLDPSPYKTLQIPKDATLATIRSVYRKLVLSCHPDKVQDETAKRTKAEQFHQVQQAYEILSDENRRRRWDERKKLADLRAEMMEERGPPRRTQDHDSPRAAPTPTFEMRGSRMYEERVPKSAKTASPKFYEEDVFSTKFADSRPSRKHDDRYGDTPLRRTSGRGPDDRRESKEADRLREKKNREAEAVARDQRTRKRERDKDKRKATQAKFRHVEEDTSDSEANEPYYSSKSESKSKRKGDERKTRRESPPRWSSKKDARDYDPELDDKIYFTQDYISKSRETGELDARRPTASRKRGESYRERPPPPPSPPIIPIDTGRRSSGDDGRRSSARTRGSRAPSPARKSTKEKRKPEVEIIDPPSHRKASLQHTPSDPRSMKNMFSSSSKSRGEPQRAATFNHLPTTEHPNVRRSETLPINSQMHRGGPVPLRRSKLQNMVDSDSSESSDTDSDVTPVIVPRTSARQQSTKYKIHQDEDARSPHTVSKEPEDYPYERTRDNSPKNPRRSSDRPPMAARSTTNARAPPSRNASYAPPSDDRPSPRQKLSRAETERMPPINTNSSPRGNGSALFGEFSMGDSPKSYHGSPKAYDDRPIRPSPSRRASEDIRERDVYPGSHHKSHGRPNYRGAPVH